MKNIRGLSLLEVLVAMGVLSILAVSTGGVITRMVLDGNLVRANLEETELKTAVCAKLNDLVSCNEIITSSSLTERVVGSYSYGRHLGIVDAAITDIVGEPERAPATKTLTIYYKREKTSFATDSTCQSGALANCEKVSIDIQHDAHNCRPVKGCTHTSAVNSPLNCVDTTIEGCILNSTSHDRTKAGTCNTATHSGSCEYYCNNGNWDATSVACKKKCMSNSPVSNESSPGIKDRCNLVTTNDGVAAIGCKTGYSGSCDYDCNDGTWSENINNCKQDCDASTLSKCERSASSHGGSSGSCISGYTGSCSYTCNDGSWSENSNACKQDCAASTLSNCRRSAKSHGGSSGSCVSGYTGSCNYTCNDGSWSENSNACKQDCDPDIISGCTFTNITHSDSGTCYNCNDGETGSRTYTCNDGTWELTNTSCRAHHECTASTLSGCKRFARTHGGSSGRCISGYTGSCSYTCNDGTWVGSESCRAYRSCTARSASGGVPSLSSGSHGTTRSGSCSSGYSGSYSYECDDGSWSGSNNCTRTYSSCSTRSASGGVPSLSSGSHGTTRSGSCRSGYSGTYSYECDDGSWDGSNNCTRTYSSCSTRSASGGVPSLSSGSHGTTRSGSCRSGYSGTYSYECDDGSWDGSNNCEASGPPPCPTLTSTTCGNTTESRCCTGGNKTVGSPPYRVTEYACRWRSGSCQLVKLGSTPCFKADTLITLVGGKLKPIQEIQIGDMVIGKEGINTVQELKVRDFDGLVYSINNSNHFVTGGHPFMTKEGWKAFNLEAAKNMNPDLKFAGALKVGDILIKEDSKEEILVKYTSQIEQTTVYNLNVDGDSTYYADGYLVHNK